VPSTAPGPTDAAGFPKVKVNYQLPLPHELNELPLSEELLEELSDQLLPLSLKELDEL
jgi:hypothetical protein